MLGSSLLLSTDIPPPPPLCPHAHAHPHPTPPDSPSFFFLTPTNPSIYPIIPACIISKPPSRLHRSPLARSLARFPAPSVVLCTAMCIHNPYIQTYHHSSLFHSHSLSHTLSLTLTLKISSSPSHKHARAATTHDHDHDDDSDNLG